MKKKKLFVGILMASAVFGLAACGGNTGTTTTSGTTTTTTTTTTGSEDPVVKNYKVNFYSNGGTAIETKTVKDGDKITVVPVPTRSGAVNTYTFEGWYTDVALTQEFNFENPITADVTLYAKWTSVLTEATKITMNGTEYATIKAAIAAIPTSGDKSTYTIILPKGTYEENGLEYNGSATIKIVGATTEKYGADVIIKGHGSNMASEKTRNLIGIQGTGNIILENVTLVSDWGREGHGSNTQAELLGTDTKGNTICYNCGFKSHQDTLRTAGKAWFYGCYIEGDVDFIWMEEAGTVALYENCEIVSVYDEAASHDSYVTAPRMAISSKVGKGLVIYNSSVKESDEAREKNQKTYLGRTPWASGYYNQVAYINTTCSDIEASGWYKTPIASEYDRTVIGWKMDKATAATLSSYTGTDILDDETVENEFSGRRAILNRIYNCGKLKYEKDTAVWDIDEVIISNGWEVAMDNSSDTLEDETAGEPTIYKFDGSVDQSSLCDGFAKENGDNKPHYVGDNGNTITIPVSGKCYVEVYGYYSGTVDAKADTQGDAVMFFNNGTTNSEVVNTYTVYDGAATNVVITAKAKTYITKIVVTPDSGIESVAVSDLSISRSTKLECVGVPLKLTANVTPANATNKSIKWTSSAPDVADIDEFTGKVTFKTAGEVTFTATARDGSGKTASIICNPVNPTWVQAEWYTTDTTLDAEDGAQEIGNFDQTTSEPCSLNVKSTFTNIAGKTIETTKGLKFNGKGQVNLSTTKGNATLTIVVARRIGKNGFLKTAAPVVTDLADASVKAKLISTVGEDVNTDVEGSLITYTYYLPSAATWKIERGDGAVENNPLVYAKCEYETRITKSTFVNYKGGSYKETKGSVVYNHNNDTTGSKVESTDEVTFDNITYKGVRANNTNDNWLYFAQNGTIKFTVADACELGMYFYQGTNLATVTLNGTTVDCSTVSAGEKEKYIYQLSGAGEVVITSNANGYLGAFEVLYPTVDNSIKSDTGLVFHGDSIEGMTNVKKWDNNTVAGTQDGFTITGSNFSNGGYLEFKNDDKVSFDVKVEGDKKAVITISSYADVASTAKLGDTDLTVTKDATNSSAENYLYVTEISASGTITISATEVQNYLNWIKVEFVEVDNSVKTDTGLVFHGDSISGMTNVKKWANNTEIGTQDGFTITGSDFSNGGYLEFKNDDKVAFDVKVESGKKAVITISSYADVASTAKLGDTDLTVTKDATNSSAENYLYVTEVTADGTVTISATSTQNYLNWIKIEFVNA